MVDWSALDIEIIGTAPNGRKAFEFIRDRRPDIVLVDVKMPVMDGMDMMELCREELPGSPAFIVLTSSDDFPTARRAFRCGVVDYLVKLELTPEMLAQSLRRAVASLKPSGPETGKAGGVALVDSALVRLLDRGFSSEPEARNAASLAGLPLGAVRYAVAVFALSPQSGAAAPDDAERARLRRCAMDLVAEVIGREARVSLVPIDLERFSALISVPAEEERAAQRADADAALSVLVGRARVMAEKYFGLDVAAGIGSAYTELLRIADSHDEARRSAEVSQRERRLVQFRAKGDESRDSYRETLSRALELRSPELLKSAFDAAIVRVRDLIPHSPRALETCAAVHQLILDRMEGAAAFLDELFPDEIDRSNCLYRAGSAERMVAWLERVGEALRDEFDQSMDSRPNRLVSDVKRFVLEHYAERLQLPDVAERFKVSPNHLSSLFKRKAGVGFSEYLAEVRVAKAKELIREGGRKVYEVAPLVGIEDAFYFSKVFKKVCGMTPSEYQDRAPDVK